MTHDAQQRRAEIRQASLTRRDSLSREDVERWGDAIADCVQRVLEQESPTTVFTYLAFGNEVPTLGIVHHLLSSGRRVVVPYVTTGSPNMTCHEIEDPERDLKRGIWGIPTPRVSRCPAVDPHDIDAALVPLVAFDDDGYRIGHGAGYYDRFLGAYRRMRRIGLAFEMQRIESCHPQEWDEPLDCLVTESGVRAFPDRR
ncbi:5-formyltetrahydrofolate cyclo-ligase [Candidatus Poribacteria bacterium]|nr:5-formyltetrahydrofolate cyclo-ligase [Candidatus Poribacteria bacterium]